MTAPRSVECDSCGRPSARFGGVYDAPDGLVARFTCDECDFHDWRQSCEAEDDDLATLLDEVGEIATYACWTGFVPAEVQHALDAGRMVRARSVA